jgi:hypothetical protein
MLKIAAAVLFLALSGCSAMNAERVRGGLNAYVGRPVADLELRMGPPDDVIELTNGRRAFQWEHAGHRQTPIGVAYAANSLLFYSPPRSYETICRLSVIVTAANDITSWQAFGDGCL